MRESNNIIEDELAMRVKDWMKTVRCYNCQKTGHIAKYCPHNNKDSNDEESEDEKPKRKLGKKSKKERVQVARELFTSDSESA